MPIGCCDVPVYPGDWVVSDAEDVVVVPREMAEEVAAEAMAMTEFEGYVDAEVSRGRTTIGLYPPNAETREQYEAFHRTRSKKNES